MAGAPNFAAKAAMDSFAVSHAAELARFNIETSIVVAAASRVAWSARCRFAASPGVGRCGSLLRTRWCILAVVCF
jgi:hypothetical protein